MRVPVGVRDLVDAVAGLQDVLHARAAQVQVAVLESHPLLRLLVPLHRERWRLGGGQHLEIGGEHLDLTGRHLGIDVLDRAFLDAAFDAHHVLAAE